MNTNGSSLMAFKESCLTKPEIKVLWEELGQRAKGVALNGTPWEELNDETEKQVVFNSAWSYKQALLRLMKTCRQHRIFVPSFCAADVRRLMGSN